MDVIKNNGESAGGNKYLKYKFALVIIATAFFLYLSWYAYNTQVDTDVDPKKLPLIEFSRQIKFKPGDPGGIEIANLDKGIYDYISGRKVSKKVVISNHKEDPVSREEMIRILGNKTVKETPVKTNSVQSTSNVSQQKSPVLAVQPKKSVKKVQLYTKKMYYIRIAKLKNADVQSRAWEILKKKAFRYIIWTKWFFGKRKKIR